MKTYYLVNVSYESFEYPEMDDVLNKLVGKDDVSSGMGFCNRDMNWEFRTQASALKAFDKLSKIKKLTSLRLEKVSE